MTLILTGYMICIGTIMANLVMIAYFLLVLREGRNLVANRLLSVFCVGQAAGYASDLFAANQVYDHCPMLLGVDLLLLLTLGPLCYLYAQAMTQLRFRLRAWHLWHLLPVVLCIGLLIPFKWQAPAVQLAQFYDWDSGRQPTPHWVVYYPKLVLLGYLIAFYRLINRHQRTIRELLSDVDQKDLRWLRGWLLIVAGLCATWVLVNEHLVTDLFLD